jgi:hypothetical protein
MPSVCIFCVGSPVTAEDGWPRWIGRGYPTPGVIRATRLGTEERTFLIDRIELKVRAVCKRCNNGWMSDLETRAERVLLPMIQGMPKTLSRELQRIAATWAVKTAMVLEHTLGNTSEKYWSPSERASFAKAPHDLPAETVVWISAYEGSMLAHFSGGVRAITSLSSPEPLADSTRATLVIGKLVLQVEADRYEETTGRKGLVWPPPHSQKAEWISPIIHNEVHWPPAGFLTDAELVAFARVPTP